MASDKLRNMCEKDLDLVYQWRNHPNVRRFMYSTQQLCIDEHYSWYFKARKDPAIDLLIYELDGQPCGFVRFSRARSIQVANWGFYLSPSASRGCGPRFGNAALKYAFVTLGLRKVCAEVLGFNDRSIAFHKKLGFHVEGYLREQFFDDSQFHDVLCFGLLSTEWKPQDGSKHAHT